MSTVVKDLGAATAYGYAVEKGYTGTEEEFAELMASYATVGQTAVNAAQTATTKASEAATSAIIATNKASEATTAAQTASTKASEAVGCVETATQKATEATQSASQASGYAQTAETAKTDAQTAKTQAETARDNAVTAKTAAETAQGKAEDAQEAAEDAAESVSASAAQIATNTADITDLKEDFIAAGLSEITFTRGRLISSYVQKFENIDILSNANWKSAIVDCSGGDVFTIHGKVNVNPGYSNLWAFFGGDDNHLMDIARYHLVNQMNNELLIAPSGANKLVLNMYIHDGNDYASYSGYVQRTKDMLNNEEYPSVPTYYQDYIKEKSVEINEVRDSSGLNGDTFIFLTDYHRQSNAKNSASLVQYLFKHTGVRFMVFGGDTQNYEKTFEAGMTETIGFKEDFDASYDKIYGIIGNHEFNSKYHDDDPVHYPASIMLTYPEAYGTILKRQELCYGGISQYGDYWVDNKAQKIRFFFLGIDAACWMKPETIAWFCNEIAEVPSDYSIVVFAHSSIMWSANYQMYAVDEAGTRAIGFALDALNARSSYTYNGVTYNYSSSEATGLVIIGGHCHFDYDSKSEHIDTGVGKLPKILVVAVTTDAYGKQENYSYNTPLTRTKGTVSEQAFDVVHLDKQNDVLYMIRVGAGVNRIFHFSATTVSSTLELTSVLSGTLTWASRNTSVATVSNGTVTAVASGSTTIIATDEDGNFEVWDVSV